MCGNTVDTSKNNATDAKQRQKPGTYLFLAARGLRLIFFDLSLFFFGGSGFACMCLP